MTVKNRRNTAGCKTELGVGLNMLHLREYYWSNYVEIKKTEIVIESSLHTCNEKYCTLKIITFLNDITLSKKNIIDYTLN